MKPRLSVAVLTLSAAGLITLVTREGYTDRAIIPVPGDKPTFGFGSTVKADGSPVRMGDTTTPVRALILVRQDVDQREAAVRKCLAGSTLTQGEWDVYLTFAYNVGTANFCGSTMARHIRDGRYTDACNQFPAWKYFQKHDCSLAANAKLCGGIWTDRLNAQRACLAEQQP